MDALFLKACCFIPLHASSHFKSWKTWPRPCLLAEVYHWPNFLRHYLILFWATLSSFNVKTYFNWWHSTSQYDCLQSCFNKVWRLLVARGVGAPNFFIHILWCHNYIRLKFRSYECNIWGSLKQYLFLFWNLKTFNF